MSDWKVGMAYRGSCKTTVPQKIREGVSLLLLLLQVQSIHFFEYLKVIFFYYRNFSFLKIDLNLIFLYLFKNPFRISKFFLLEKKQKDIYTYGETPLTTLEHIAKKCQISKEDTVFELGTGRGRACFWLQQFIQCKVIGIEYVPEFIANAEAIKKRYHLERVEFRQEDMLKADVTGATVIYLYGSCLEDKQIEQLIENLSCLPQGTKIISVSYPLTDYTLKPLFEIMNCFEAKFPWGTAEVYLQYRK